MVQLTPLEKIKKAKMLMLKDRPFFSFILLHMREQEANIKTLGVNKYGRLFYNPKYVDSLTPETMESVLCHEVLHVVLKHFLRLGKRNMYVMNVATDLAVNTLLKNDNFTLDEGWLIPNSNDQFVHNGKVLCYNVSKKSSEQIYQEIYQELRKQQQKKGNTPTEPSEDDSGAMPDPQDSHMVDSDEGKEDMGEMGGDEQGVEKYWQDVVTESYVNAKQKGNVPLGMERYIEKLLKPKINWRNILYREVTNAIPFDYTWRIPSKKSHAIGTYLPSTYGEKVEVVVHIDTSGSMSKHDLTVIKSEVLHLGRSFLNIDMQILVGDIGVQKVYHVRDDAEKIKQIQLIGGGGTSHRALYKWLEEHKPKARLLINFTDGETDAPNSSRLKTLWVITPNGSMDLPFGMKIRMED